MTIVIVWNFKLDIPFPSGTMETNKTPDNNSDHDSETQSVENASDDVKDVGVVSNKRDAPKVTIQVCQRTVKFYAVLAAFYC